METMEKIIVGAGAVMLVSIAAIAGTAAIQVLIWMWRHILAG